MNAIIFVRVSRRDQDYQRQIQDLRAIAISMDVEVVKEIAEKISGATKNQHREAIQELLKLVHQGQVDKVLVQEVSRLGRSTVEVLQVVEELTDLGVSIYVQNFGIETLKKGSYPISYRTLFGDIKLTSPRFYCCACPSNLSIRDASKTFSPLNELLCEHTSPERLYLESRWGVLLSYHGATHLLKDILPLSKTYNAASLRNHLVRVAERKEEMLGEEQFMFAGGCQMDWN